MIDLEGIESVIETIEPPAPAPNAEIDAIITGKKAYARATYFRHKETGNEHSWISAGICLNKVPLQSAAIFVAADRDDGGKGVNVGFHVLEDFSAYSPSELLLGCLRLRKKYGFDNGDGLLRNDGWISDYDRLISDVNIFNVNLRDVFGNKMHGIHVNCPQGWGPMCHATYINKVYEMRQSGRLDLEASPNLINGLHQIVPEMDYESIPDSHPLVAAFCYTLFFLSVRKPWMEAIPSKPSYYI